MSSDSKSETPVEDTAPARKKTASRKTAVKSAKGKGAPPKRDAEKHTDERGPEADAAKDRATKEAKEPAGRDRPVPRNDPPSAGSAAPSESAPAREHREHREPERRERSDEGERRERQENEREGGGGGKGRRRRGGPVRGRVRGKGRRRGGGGGGGGNDGNNRRKDSDEQQDRQSSTVTGPPVEVDGMLEVAPKGFGFLRRPEKDFEQSREDVFLPPELIRTEGLRVGMWVHGIAREGNRGPQLVEVTSINGMKPEKARKLPYFEELKACNPTKRIPFETTSERFTTRVIDMVTPVGRGQRGLIVSPPRSGKTTLLLHLAEAVRERHPENLHLMILLVDERPEEVTEFKRQLPEAEIYASSNDMPAKNHCRLAELCIERAKRLVEAGQHVFLVLDSITRLARAYNNSMRGGKGRGYQSGGIVAGALEMPRRLFAAARNTREAGSLTIIGTALVQTNAKADEAIFQEFKGTGNMELVLDRKIAENFIYPAVDIFKSGTRREELLLPEHMLHKIYLIRRGLSGHKPLEAMERLLFFLKKFPNNAQMLLEIKG